MPEGFLLPNRLHNHSYQVFCRLIEVVERLPVRRGPCLLLQIGLHVLERCLQQIQTVVHPTQVILRDNDLPGGNLQ